MHDIAICNTFPCVSHNDMAKIRCCHFVGKYCQTKEGKTREKYEYDLRKNTKRRNGTFLIKENQRQ